MDLRVADLAKDPIMLAEITKAIAEQVEKSFAKNAHPMRVIKQQEVKRRLTIAVKWFRELKAKSFTNERAAHECGRALDAELSLRDYTIPTSSLWVPDSCR